MRSPVGVTSEAGQEGLAVARAATSSEAAAVGLAVAALREGGDRGHQTYYSASVDDPSVS